jgi:glycosyltransferase involved in cell wall biosynthesis
MRISLYTSVKNGIFFDYHVVDMLKHHLPFADEIVVNDGNSTDGTYEKMSAISPKIKVFRTEWGKPDGCDWLCRFKNAARERCTGDWCILLDIDEFIPEWEFARLRDYLAVAREGMIPLRFLHFYGNYKVHYVDPSDGGIVASRKMAIHRNLPNIEVWGDGCHVRFKGQPVDWNCSQEEFVCHHFGLVRNPARLRQKWRNVLARVYGRRPWWKTFALPAFLFNWLPHRWDDPLFLHDTALYEGPYIKAVLDNPDEFVRDGFRLYERLKKQLPQEQLTETATSGEHSKASRS